jgi:hypothetical protein
MCDLNPSLTLLHNILDLKFYIAEYIYFFRIC